MRIGIVGLGYVGLPLAVAFAAADVEVVGVDIDSRKVDAVASGRSYIEDVPDGALAAARPRLRASTDYALLGDVDAVLIAVPTPLTANREPDLAPLLACAEALGGVLRAGQLVVLESTSYPGTTRERLAPLLEARGLRAGVDFHLAFSAERVDPGRTDFTLATTPKVIGGLTGACGDRAEEVYRLICRHIVRVSSPEAAELTKLLENIFRAVNIALVNELALLTDRMGIDIWEVVAAASTKPYGFMRFEPGPGWAVIASRSTRSISPGERASSTCRPSSSSWPARSTSRCPTTAWSGSNGRSTEPASRSTAHASGSSG
jgi:UDP-N-acetyl-D-glucosamine dehydrogenase